MCDDFENIKMSKQRLYSKLKRIHAQNLFTASMIDFEARNAHNIVIYPLL